MPANVVTVTLHTSYYVEITTINFTDLYIRQIMTSKFFRTWIVDKQDFLNEWKIWYFFKK